MYVYNIIYIHLVVLLTNLLAPPPINLGVLVMNPSELLKV